MSVLLARIAAVHRGGVFDPSSLYVGGYIGPRYDLSDLSTLFQNTAGTMPVTAAGQTVQLVKDKSGGGLDATGQFTLQQDGGGRYFASLNGTSDYLTFASMGAGMLRHFAWAGYLRNTTATQCVLELTTNFNNTDGAFIHYFNTTGRVDYDQRESVTGGTYNTALSTTNLQTNQVVQFTFNRTAATEALQRAVWVDNVLLPLTQDSGSSNVLLTSPFPSTAYFLGARAGTSLFAAMNLYQFLGINRTMTPTERTNLDAYMKEKAGI